MKIFLLSALAICLLALVACGDESETALNFTSNGDGTCYVSGIGDCTVEDLVIPSRSPKGDKVTAIGEKAFFDCFTLKSVTVPDSVTYIGDNAFRGSIYLTEINLPKSVSYIGKTPLADCKALEKITVESGNKNYSSLGNCLIDTSKKTIIAGCNTSRIPFNGTVTAIGDYAFFDLDKLQEVDFSNLITHIGDHAFESCDGLKKVTGADALVDIGDYAFAACDGMKTFELDTNISLTSIGKYAFHACDSLTSLHFPKTLKTVGDGAFWSCHNFKKAIISDISAWAQIDFGSSSATPLNDGELFLGKELVTEVKIADGTEKIGSYAFYGCGSITSVSLPDSVKTIGEYAFSDCAALSSLELGAGVKAIGDLAFRNCSAINSVNIPKNTETIGDYVFFGCSALDTITVTAGNTKYSAANNCLIDIANKTLIRGGNSSSIPQDAGIETIADYAFHSCDKLASVKIPASVKKIGVGAFEGCSALSNAEFADDKGWKAYQLETDAGVSFAPSSSALISTYAKYFLINN